MGIAIAMAVLFGVVLFAANHAVWLTATILDTDRFVAAFAPLPQDEDVSLALAHKTADAVVESYEVTEVIAETLPEGISFLALPLASGVQDLIAKASVEIIRSDAFTTVWTGALTGSHRIATAYVGVFEDGAVVAEDGVAVLDLTELGDRVAEKLGTDGFGLLENSDRDLTIELFALPDSGVVKFIVDVMYSVRWALIALVVVLLIGAYVVAPDRRRITTWIGGAAVVAMLLSLVDSRLLRSAVTGGAEDPIQQAGAEAAWDIIFQRFIWQTWIALLIGVVMILIVWATGNSETALGIRSAVSAKTGAGTAADDGNESSLIRFVTAHRRLIEWGFGLLAIGFLLVAPPVSFGIALVILVVVAVVIVGVEYLSAAVGDKPG